MEAMPSTATPQRSSVEVAEGLLTAHLYNPMLWLGERLGMARLRHELLADARGAVLEIGAGTGLNLPHYPAGLDELVLTEPGPRIGARIDLSHAPDGVPARLVHAAAEQLPFADASFDTVVSTLVLCTVSDPDRAVSEIRRVLRPGGQLLFLEHVRAAAGWRRRLQRRAVRPWSAFADGCRCDRPTVQTLADAMHIESLNRATWRGMPAIVKPLVWGTAAART
jgi:SAM-dependent methyltransferase